MPAAKPVLNATTTSGEKPYVMASFPNTGAMPKNIAELNAARTPAVCFLNKNTSLWFSLTCIHIYYLINDLTSSRNSSFKKSPFCNSACI